MSETAEENTKETTKKPRNWRGLAMKSGAVATSALAFASFAGKAQSASSEAAPTANVPTATAADSARHLLSLEKDKKPKPQLLPTGVAFSDILTTSSSIQQEANDILNARDIKMVRWYGVLAVHKPTKKLAAIDFTDAPRAYDYFGSPFQGYDPSAATNHTVEGIMFQPALFMYKVGKHDRMFALAYDTESKKTQFLDIAYAEEIGALSSYACDGQPAGVMKKAGDPSNYPFITSSFNSSRGFADKKLQIVDVKNKVHNCIMTDVMPHM